MFTSNQAQPARRIFVCQVSSDLVHQWPSASPRSPRNQRPEPRRSRTFRGDLCNPPQTDRSTDISALQPKRLHALRHDASRGKAPMCSVLSAISSIIDMMESIPLCGRDNPPDQSQARPWSGLLASCPRAPGIFNEDMSGYSGAWTYAHRCDHTLRNFQRRRNVVD
jgi:hypothetical protein